MSKDAEPARQTTEATIPKEFQSSIFGQGGALTEAQRLFGSGQLAPQREMGNILSSLVGGAQGNYDQQQNYIQQLQGQQQGLANLDLQNSAATQGIIDRSTGALQQQLQRGTIPSIGDAAMNAGQFGSSRQGIAEGVATAEAQRNIGDVTANILGNAQGQELQAQQAALQLAPLIQNMQNSSLQGALGLGQLEQGFADQAGQNELNNLLQYANLIQGFMPQGSGTTTTTGGGPSDFNQILGGATSLGGLALLGKGVKG